MTKFLLFSLISLLSVISVINSSEIEEPNLKKPLCGVCKLIVKELAKSLDHGNVDKVIHTFCKREALFLAHECEKLIKKNLHKIIEKLRQHMDVGKICRDISLCSMVIRTDNDSDNDYEHYDFAY